MRVLIDGFEMAADNDVKVIVERKAEGEEECNVELHLTLTDEGLVQDLVVDGEVDDTNSITYEEIMEAMVGDDRISLAKEAGDHITKDCCWPVMVTG